jgi:hypothetical protein
MKDFQCQHGIYLVGWFNCVKWDANDSKKPLNLELKKAKEFFNDQATALTDDLINIKAFVMDASLR